MVFTSKNTKYESSDTSTPTSIANDMESGAKRSREEEIKRAQAEASKKALRIQSDARSSMSMFDYQKAAASTAIYPEAGTGGFKALAYLFALLSEESGEANGKWAKFIRDDTDVNTTREMIIKEIGDVLWAVANIANEVDASLSEVAQGNIDKLASRKERGVLSGSGDDR